MNAVVAARTEVVLMLVGRGIRRDLRITFEGKRYGFRVALYPKGKGEYYDRGGHLALGCGERMSILDATIHIGGAMFEITIPERAEIEEWMASLPREGAK